MSPNSARLLACAALAVAGLAHAQSGERTGGEIVKQQCASCHETGVNGAPRIDDRAAWAQRMKQGLDATVRAAIRGHDGMPARGGRADLTDAEFRSAILYMFNPAGAGAKGVAERRAPPRELNKKVADGVEIYLGVSPTPSRGVYHLNISLRDSATHAAIPDAQVQARVASPLGGATKTLAATTVNDLVSYGNDFRITGDEPYTITVQVRRPQAAHVIETQFDFKR